MNTLRDHIRHRNTPRINVQLLYEYIYYNMNLMLRQLVTTLTLSLILFIQCIFLLCLNGVRDNFVHYDCTLLGNGFKEFYESLVKVELLVKEGEFIEILPPYLLSLSSKVSVNAQQSVSVMVASDGWLMRRTRERVLPMEVSIRQKVYSRLLHL